MTLSTYPSEARRAQRSQGLAGYKNTRICVVGGGAGPERQGSITSAHDVLGVLNQHDIPATYVDLVDLPSRSLGEYDIAFLLTHGPWGEDGRVQGFLETLRMPYTGSRVLGSAMSMDKVAANTIARDVGLRVPSTVVLAAAADETEIQTALNLVGDDAILRPSSGGGSRGIIRTGSVAEIGQHLASYRQVYESYLLTSFVRGTEISVAYASGAEGSFHFPPLATFHDGEFYDHDIKHDAAARSHVCPAKIGVLASRMLDELCPRLYAAMRLSGFARFDFIVDQGGTPNFLEVNTIPGMSRQGNLATMAIASRMSYDDLVLAHLDMRVTHEAMSL